MALIFSCLFQEYLDFNHSMVSFGGAKLETHPKDGALSQGLCLGGCLLTLSQVSPRPPGETWALGLKPQGEFLATPEEVNCNLGHLPWRN